MLNSLPSVTAMHESASWRRPATALPRLRAPAHCSSRPGWASPDGSTSRGRVSDLLLHRCHLRLEDGPAASVGSLSARRRPIRSLRCRGRPRLVHVQAARHRLLPSAGAQRRASREATRPFTPERSGRTYGGGRRPGGEWRLHRYGERHLRWWETVEQVPLARICDTAQTDCRSHPVGDDAIVFVPVAGAIGRAARGVPTLL